MKKILFVFYFFLLCLSVFSQPKGALSPIIDQLDLYYYAHPNEKIIIQTDKDFYQPGENIWFSCWHWSENKSQTSPRQNEMEIRLLGPDGKTVLSDKYWFKESIVGGDFLLPDDMEAGNYFLAALFPGQENTENVSFREIGIRPFYQSSLLISVVQKEAFLQKEVDNEIDIQVKSLTKGAVKNQRLEYTISAGEQTIEEGKLKTDDAGNAAIRFRLPETENGMPFILSVFDSRKGSVETVQLASETDQLNVTFYPEGGTIIPEQPSKVGFYVTNKLGIPVPIEGEIRDSENRTMFPVKTFVEGFGFFPLKAVRNARYSLYITKGYGKGQRLQLPQVNTTGSSLSIVQKDEEFLRLNLAFADQLNHKISVMASQGAGVFWAADLQINGIGQLKIPVAKLPQGIVLLSSFSDEGSLLNQRLVDIPESTELKIDILAFPESVAKKDEINLQLKFSDERDHPLSGFAQLSVSDVVCTDQQRPVLPFEMTFNSLLKNKIVFEKHGLSGNNEMQETFDYLLIANELSNYDWSRISGFKAGKQAEKLIGTGENISFSEEFEASLKRKVQSLNQPKQASTSFSSAIPDEYFVTNSGLISKKPKRTVNDTPKDESYKKYLETSTNLLDVVKIIKPFDLEGSKIIFPGGKNSINAQGGALIVVDGQQMGEDASILSSLNPHDVEKINVSTQPMDIQRYTGLNSVGLIEITTKRGKMAEPAKEKAPDAIQYDGDYRKPREFQISEKTGLQTTTYWNGRIFIDETGKISLKIPGSNVVSDFIITIEGMGENGQFGHATKRIKVTE